MKIIFFVSALYKNCNLTYYYFRIVIFKLILTVILFSSLPEPAQSQQFSRGQYFSTGGINFNHFPDYLFYSNHSNRAFQFKPNQLSLNWNLAWGYLARFDIRWISFAVSSGFDFYYDLRVRYTDFADVEDEFFSGITTINYNIQPSMIITLPPTFAGRYYFEAGYNYRLPIITWEDFTDNLFNEYYTKDIVKSMCKFNFQNTLKSFGFGLMGQDMSIGLNYLFISFNNYYFSSLNLIARFYISNSRLQTDKVYFQ